MVFTMIFTKVFELECVALAHVSIYTLNFNDLKKRIYAR